MGDRIARISASRSLKNFAAFAVDLIHAIRPHQQSLFSPATPEFPQLPH
jgi:hypothetical protein